MDLNKIFENLGSIEKKIHVSWKNKNILNLNFNMIKNGIYNLRKLNPDYSFEISDDDDVNDYLENKLSPGDFELIKYKHIVEKTDLWRLLKIYNEGGVYMDIDRLCNIPLSCIINNSVKCVLPTYRDFDFSQDIMISCSKNIIHKRAIELNLERRRSGEERLVYLGPDTYLHAISEILINKQSPRENNQILFNQLREIINKCEYLITYRENPPYDTIVYQGPEIKFDKKAFYRDQGVKSHQSENEMLEMFKNWLKNIFKK